MLAESVSDFFCGSSKGFFMPQLYKHNMAHIMVNTNKYDVFITIILYDFEKL